MALVTALQMTGGTQVQAAVGLPAGANPPPVEKRQNAGSAPGVAVMLYGIPQGSFGSAGEALQVGVEAFKTTT